MSLQLCSFTPFCSETVTFAFGIPSARAHRHAMRLCDFPGHYFAFLDEPLQFIHVCLYSGKRCPITSENPVPSERAGLPEIINFGQQQLLLMLSRVLEGKYPPFSPLYTLLALSTSIPRQPSYIKAGKQLLPPRRDQKRGIHWRTCGLETSLCDNASREYPRTFLPVLKMPHTPSL